MDKDILLVSLGLLFLTVGAPANAQTAQQPGEAGGEAGGAVEMGDDGAVVVYYDINRNLSLSCPLAADAAADAVYVWQKNNASLEDVPALKGRYKTEGAAFALTVRAVEDDYGAYSCALGGRLARFEVRGRPVARLPDNTNVVEGQNIKLQCRLVGKPYPRVAWLYSAAEDGEGNATLPGAAAGRARLETSEQGVVDGALVLTAAERADAGRYWCAVPRGQGDHTTLRVKDMYAALWPFLGICAEVLVLCAVILLYEKRRTKPELDDSDTDNHDQKKS